MTSMHRLTSARAFRRVLSEGARGTSDGVAIVALPSGEDRPARFGVSVGRRAGGAVRRNRVKRRLREATRVAGSDVPAGVDLVVIARADTTGTSFQSLVEHVRSAARRAGVA